MDYNNDYNNLGSEQPEQQQSNLSKMLGTLVALIVIGGLFTFVGSFFITTYQNDAAKSAQNTRSIEASFAALEQAGVDTNLAGVPGAVNQSPDSVTWDFRKTADISFYQQQVDEAKAEGRINDYANALNELASAYIDQQGGVAAAAAANAYKTIIGDRAFKREDRAKAMRDLAGMFCRSGLDTRVFDDIYTGAYAQFYAEGDPMLAGRRMMETSFAMHPRARTAVSVAHMYIDPLVNKDLTESQRENMRSRGLAFLKNAEVLARDEYDPSNISGEYASYLFWRAVSYGQLAMEYDQYINDAEAAYEDAFAYVNQYAGTYNTSVTDIIPFTHLRYVNFLTEVYGEDAAADIAFHLDTVVALVASDPNPEVSTFMKYLSNKRKDYENTGTYTHWLRDARSYSASYDSFLNEHGLPEITS